MRFYNNGNCIVCISSDGTKIRQCSDENPEPSFAENIDVKITEKCSVGCPFCYENCTPAGKHADLDSYGFIDHLHPHTEMSINGNDMDHPQLESFLARLKKQNIYCNITVNQKQFIDNFEKICTYQSMGFISGIGVSFNHYDKEFIDRFLSVKHGVMHVIAGIVTEDELKQLAGYNINLLVLGFKERGRGEQFMESSDGCVEARIRNLHVILPNLLGGDEFRCICFDNLALSQLGIREMISDDEWEKFYMGDDGSFTFYIDLVNGKFARNSIANRKLIIGKRSIDEMFAAIQRIMNYKKKNNNIKLWQH